MADFREIKNSVWSDPTAAMNGTTYAGTWRRKNSGWEWERGQARITRTAAGGLWLHGNTGSGMAGTHAELIGWLAEQYNTDPTQPVEVFRELARRYGADWTDNDDNRRATDQVRRARMAAVVWPVLQAAAMDAANQSTKGVQYLNGRGFSVDNGAFGLLTAQSINEAEKAAKTAFPSLSDADIKRELDALRVNTATAETHPVVVNCETNGRTAGFSCRATDGTAKQKYLNSTGMAKGVFCGQLERNAPAVVVEGPLDALRLRSLGVRNVIAMNGATVGDALRDILQAYEITEVTLWPDLEFDNQGKRITKRTADALHRLAETADSVEGWQVRTVRVVDVPQPDGVDLNGYKADPDSWAKEHPDQAAAMIYNAPYWFWWEFAQFEQHQLERYQAGTLNPTEAMNEARGIYRRIADPFQRETVRQRITNPAVCGFYKGLGITPDSLRELDDLNRNEAYKNEVGRAAEKLAKEAKTGADPDRVARVLAELNENQARGTGTRKEWDEQTGRDWADEVAEFARRPEMIRTKWELGRHDDTGSWKQRGNIEFWPADITVFCAPTSHGKTMVLFQSLLDMVAADISAEVFRKYIFVSCEENHAQLFARALNVYIPNNPDVLFTGTRRAALRSILRGELPYNYSPDQAENLQNWLSPYLEAFKRDVLPRLDLIHTEATTEAIAANIDHYAKNYRRQGVEVGAVFVDYFQLLTADGAERTARNYEIKTICKVLKDTAARMELPFVMAAQLNRQALAEGLDGVTLANIGEGADIERIAHDVYLVWQTDKTRREIFITTQTDKDGNIKAEKPNWQRGGRVERMFTSQADGWQPKTGYLYVERLKAREGVTGWWGLLPYDGESGQIYETANC